MFENFKGRHVTVTGGLGFIGSNLAVKLVELGAHVAIIDTLDDTCGGNNFNIHEIKDKVEVYVSDIKNEELVPRILKKTDYIFNLAGKTSHIESIENPDKDFQINFQSQYQFLNLCKTFCPDIKIIYAGTRQVYGSPKYLPIDEEHPVDPIDINGINKYSAERYHVLYNKFYNLPTVVIRLTNTYGPKQLIKHNRYGVTGWFINRIITGNEITIFNKGELKRDFTYVDDAVNAFLIAAIEEKTLGKVYNLGGKRHRTLKEFADTLLKVAGKGSIKNETLPESLANIDIGDSYSDFSKIRKELGWQPQIDLNTGIRKTLDFYNENKSYYL